MMKSKESSVIRIFCLFLLFCFSAGELLAQTDVVVGPTTVGTGQIVTYSYTVGPTNPNGEFAAPVWSATLGSVVSGSTTISGDGMTTTVSIHWGATVGTGTLKITEERGH